MVVVSMGPRRTHEVFISGIPESRCHQAVLELDCESEGSEVPPRKRQRLTHLSPEEKSLRRKLKNRVAAQTARDRKKAKMGELEQQVLDLEMENEKLHLENRLLQEQAQNLQIENQEFRQRLGLNLTEAKKIVEFGVDPVGMVTGSSESAALRLRVPLQKVQAQLSSKPKSSPLMCAAAFLQILSLISYMAFWTQMSLKCYSKVTPWASRCCHSWMNAELIQSPPPHIHKWGPHQRSWKPIMN